MSDIKNILCFGDSNTWGAQPGSLKRYPANVRWPGVAAEALGPGYHIIEEGLNGRTTVFEDPTSDHCRSGIAWLPTCLASHRPLDLVILALGLNDLQVRYSATVRDVAMGAGRLVRAVRTYPESGPNGKHPPQVLLLAPAPMHPDIAGLPYGVDMHGQDGCARSRELGKAYEAKARELGCHFFNAARVVPHASAVDGLHLEPEDHKALGFALAAEIRGILEG